MTCPNCFSNNIQPVTEVNSKTKGYGCCKGLLGYSLFGNIGLACGLCGMGKGKTTTNVLWVCSDCGHKWNST